MAPRIVSRRTGSASVIFLHGLGDSGSSWNFLANEAFARPQLNHINFVLPSAPVKFLASFGDSCPAWFDIKKLSVPMEKAIDDIAGIQKTLDYVNDLIESEIASGIPANRIVVGGFSQGGAITQCMALTTRHKLAGFVSLSGMLPVPSHFKGIAQKINLDTPIFFAHGTEDLIVPTRESEISKRAFEELGFKDLQLKMYPNMAHSLDSQELAHILDFFERVVPTITDE